ISNPALRATCTCAANSLQWDVRRATAHVARFLTREIRMHRLLAHTSALLAALAIGCSASSEPTSENLGAAEEQIAGGYVDMSDTAVVGIYDYSVGALCSGSLIAPNVVLTARHCVSPVLNEVQGGVSCQTTTFGGLHAASSFFVTTKYTVSYN